MFRLTLLALAAVACLGLTPEDKAIPTCSTVASLSTGGCVQNVKGTRVYVVEDDTVYEYSTTWAPEQTTFDVRAFGAKCDGVTNDTAAIQAAADAGGSIHVSAGLGACLTDQITVTKRTAWTCDPAAVLKMRSASLTASTAVLLFSGGGANDSSVTGCRFDGNKSALASTYPDGLNLQWTGIMVTGGAARMKILRNDFLGFVRFGLTVFSGNDHVLDGNTVRDSGGCLLFQNSIGTAILNTRCSDIGHPVTTEAFQHATEIRDCEGCLIQNYTVRDYHPPDYADPLTGTDPVGNAISFERIQRSTLDSLYAFDYCRTETPCDSDGARGFDLSNFLDTQISNIHSKGFPFGIVTNGMVDTSVTNFSADCNYALDPTLNDWLGFTVTLGGLYPQAFGGDISQNSRSIFASRNLQLSNGLVKRCEIGLFVAGEGVMASNVRSVANTRNGFHILDVAGNIFPTAITPKPSQFRCSNCVSEYNGHNGLRTSATGGAARLQWLGGSLSNNGQNYRAESASKCSGNECNGAYFSSGSYLRLADAEIADRQGADPADAVSFQPGTTASARCSFDGGTCGIYTVALLHPNIASLGKRIVLVNADGSGPVDVLIRDFCDNEGLSDPFCDGNIVGTEPPSFDKTAMDLAIVETPTHPVTFSETGNLTTLTGTFSTGGTFSTDLTGVGSVLLTDITGPTWIKADGEYRMIQKVIDDDSAVLSAAFTAPLSGDTVQKLTVDVQTAPTQDDAVHLEAAVTGPIQMTGLDLSGNKQAIPLSNATSVVDFLYQGNVPSQIRTISATASTTLPVDSDLVVVTGTTNITSIVASYPSRLVTLQFTGTADLVDGSNLKLDTSFTDDTVGRMIVLRCDGADWHEVSRVVN